MWSRLRWNAEGPSQSTYERRRICLKASGETTRRASRIETRLQRTHCLRWHSTFQRNIAVLLEYQSVVLNYYRNHSGIAYRRWNLGRNISAMFGAHAKEETRNCVWNGSRAFARSLRENTPLGLCRNGSIARIPLTLVITRAWCSRCYYPTFFLASAKCTATVGEMSLFPWLITTSLLHLLLKWKVEETQRTYLEYQSVYKVAAANECKKKKEKEKERIARYCRVASKLLYFKPLVIIKNKKYLARLRNDDKVTILLQRG